ncbi:hypothetical protein GCM10011391_11650 [Pullulanibacillus camelliae]|uniref:Uncharacterized protein n=2 Tax=Pullulanibacillus camelliae TaxID=1707096 RepID=A0A8J2VNF2_9BACL|nr:hypothetical protein GCM10011391_11650 [Pullulanibacillus camelliae]
MKAMTSLRITKQLSIRRLLHIYDLCRESQSHVYLYHKNGKPYKISSLSMLITLFLTYVDQTFLMVVEGEHAHRVRETILKVLKEDGKTHRLPAH